MEVRAFFWFVGLLPWLVACPNPELAVLSPEVSRSIDDTVHVGGTAHVDLLLVVDNSKSMREEQQSLQREIPRLVEGLANPPDEDGDGTPDWNAVESLRVAVVTTDLGTAGVPTNVPGCVGHGDAGALRVDLACGGDGAIQSWVTGDDPAAFAGRVGCLAQAGVEGCGFEQQLAAAVAALEQSGFPREEALLSVLVLTDEEDCSLANPAQFFAGLTDVSTLNVECTRRADQLMPIEEVARRLRQGRDDGRFVFAALAGLPVDLVGAEPAVMLADPRMQYVEEVVSAGDNRGVLALRAACTAAQGGEVVGSASPGRRLVELADQLGDGVVRSICEDSFQPAIAELTHKIGARLGGACLGRALTPDAEGRVECVVREVLPEGMGCSELPARVDLGPTAEGRSRCEVLQDPRGGDGWFYDVADGRCDRLAFTEAARPSLGATIRFQCLVDVDVLSSDLEQPDSLGVGL